MRRLAGPEGLGLLDDAALLAPTPGTELVLTVDAIVAGVHFFADDPPEAVAAKALGVNLSDLAAKGARPRGFLLSLALPKSLADAGGWLKAFAAGLGREAAAAACPLLGGDTVSTPGPLSAVDHGDWRGCGGQHGAPNGRLRAAIGCTSAARSATLRWA